MNYLRPCRLALAGSVALSLCSVVSANNNLFLPGDAFFPTELTAEDLSRLRADPDAPPIFVYSAFGGYGGAFCGFAGYNRAKIPGLDEAFIANLKKAYARIRKYQARELVEQEVNGKKTLIESNCVRVLFYPQSFDFPKYRIGLRYNENWVAATVKFGHKREHVRLCCLVDDKEAVEESWRDATLVAPLKATLPDVELKPVPMITEAPITIHGKLKAFVLDSRPLTTYFDPDDLYSPVLIVDSSSIAAFSCEDGKMDQI